MFRWGASNEIADAGIYQALMTVDRLKKGRTSAPDLPEVKSVDDAIVQKTIKHCSTIVGNMIKLQRTTGMRPVRCVI